MRKIITAFKKTLGYQPGDELNSDMSSSFKGNPAFQGGEDVIEVLFVIALLTVGGFLRLYNLSGSPSSLNWDEASLGYNAYSILKTTKDEYGKTLPFYTRSFDDYKSAVPIYLMIPSIKIFGLNEFGVRFPSAFLGTISILIVYLLVKTYFKSSVAATFSGFLFAIEPWSVHFSRVYHEANIANFFLLLGILFYLYSRKINILLVISLLLLIISMFTYHSNKAVVPVFIFALSILDFGQLRRYSQKIIQFCAVAFASLFILFIITNIKSGGAARFASTNIFSKSPQNNVLSSLTDGHKLLILKLARSNTYYFLWEIGGRYLSYLSPYNLFIREPLEPTSKISGSALLYPVEFFFLFLGIGYLLKNYRNYRVIILLLFLSPMPAVFTWNWFQPNRVVSLLTIYSILTGVGMSLVITAIGKKLRSIRITYLLYMLSTLYLLLMSFYLFDAIQILSVNDYSGAWQPGFRESVPIVMQNEEKYNKVVIDTPHAQPYIFYLFYGKYDPYKYLRELDLEKIGTPRKVYDFGKFEFRKIDWDEDQNLPNTLFVGNTDQLTDKLKEDVNVNLFMDVMDRWNNVSTRLVGTK